MCVDFQNFEICEKKVIAYKVVRTYGSDFRSVIPVRFRESQNKPYSFRLYDIGRGNVRVYKIGKTVKSKPPGFYCFKSLRIARGRMAEDHRILKVEIPEGAMMSVGTFITECDSINSTILKILEEIV